MSQRARSGQLKAEPLSAAIAWGLCFAQRGPIIAAGPAAQWIEPMRQSEFDKLSAALDRAIAKKAVELAMADCN
jgi:hypothetical protein